MTREKEKKMNVIVVGGGKVGRKLERILIMRATMVLIDIKVKSATEFKMIIMM